MRDFNMRSRISLLFSLFFFCYNVRMTKSQAHKHIHPLALVTGGAGFIGSQVVDALIADGWRVAVIDDLSSGKRRNVHPAAKFLKMDIRDPKMTKIIMDARPDVILHFAAQISVRRSIADPVADAEVNVSATLRILESACKAGVKRFIFAGSGGVLSDDSSPLPTDEEHTIEPKSPYGIAKLTIERYGEFYRKEYGLPFVALRFANVYGPRQNAKGEAGVVALFTTQMLANAPVSINGDGKQTRDFIYVGDVVRAVMLALKDRALQGSFHIGTGKETSVNDLYKKLATAIGYRKKARKGPADTQAVRRSALDAGKFMRATGWKPRMKLADGLKQTVLSFQTEEKGKKVCLYPFMRLI
jgi:UDP-glucose 4-epimerase